MYFELYVEDQSIGNLRFPRGRWSMVEVAMCVLGTAVLWEKPVELRREASKQTSAVAFPDGTVAVQIEFLLELDNGD